MAVVVTQSDEAKALMEKRGWSTGYVIFGAGASESTVKVLTAVSLLGKEFKLVELDFSDMALGEEDKMGVKCAEWKLLSGGRSYMPALAIDGVLYMEADGIVAKLAADTNAPPEVVKLINLSLSNNQRLLEAAKHWAWSGLHKSMGYAMVNQDHYTSYGEGQKDAAWEKETCQIVHDFLQTLEDTLTAKGSINGYFVGDSMTLADCSLINWYLTFSAITALDVDSRYPKFAENWKALKAKAPAGASYHYDYFPGFGDYCANANKEARANGFDINKSMPPLGKEEGRAYLARHKVQETLSLAVSQILRERPSDPLKAISEYLLKAA